VRGLGDGATPDQNGRGNRPDVVGERPTMPRSQPPPPPVPVTSQGRHLALRTFVAGGRFFEVIGTTPAGEAADDAEAFVRSFVPDL
jgi:hypothetical protein